MKAAVVAISIALLTAAAVWASHEAGFEKGLVDGASNAEQRYADGWSASEAVLDQSPEWRCFEGTTLQTDTTSMTMMICAEDFPACEGIWENAAAVALVDETWSVTQCQVGRYVVTLEE